MAQVDCRDPIYSSTRAIVVLRVEFSFDTTTAAERGGRRKVAIAAGTRPNQPERLTPLILSSRFAVTLTEEEKKKRSTVKAGIFPWKIFSNSILSFFFFFALLVKKFEKFHLTSPYFVWQILSVRHST